MVVKIKSPKDFWAGLMFIGVGLFFLIWALTHYQMGTAVRMGPAYFPAVLGGLLAVLGADRAARLVRDRRPAGAEVPLPAADPDQRRAAWSTAT